MTNLIKESGNRIEGHTGTWYIIDQLTLPDDFVLYLMESEQYGDDAPAIIVGEDGRVFLDEVVNGFSDLDMVRRLGG